MEETVRHEEEEGDFGDGDSHHDQEAAEMEEEGKEQAALEEKASVEPPKKGMKRTFRGFSARFARCSAWRKPVMTHSSCAGDAKTAATYIIRTSTDRSSNTYVHVYVIGGR